MQEYQICLAAARVNAGLTQRDVAKILKVSERTIVNWEKGTFIPNTATLNMLSQIYRIPVEGFLLGKRSILSE
jgi:transcriptional regulator with XRE-family HTH domain